MVTIVVVVSRKHFLTRLFESLNNLECNVEKTNLFVYVDGDYTLYEKTMHFVSDSKFKTPLCKYGSRKVPADVSSMTKRRRRIGEIHNEIKTQLITPLSAPQYVFLIEDDTLVPPHALKQLMQPFWQSEFELPKPIGFISGVEIGRQGFDHIGGWLVDDAVNINTITSVPLAEGRAEIVAAGLYCCLTTLENYKLGTFEPFEKILGPDFTFGLSLTRAGFRNFIDYSVNCVHMTQLKDITVQNTEIIQVKFDKMESERFGWKLDQL